MEYLLSQIAIYFDPDMLRIQAEPYFSVEAKLYLRLTVIATDIILLAAVLWYCRCAYQLQIFSQLQPGECCLVTCRFVASASVSMPFRPQSSTNLTFATSMVE